jgi:hypothetical protein
VSSDELIISQTQAWVQRLIVKYTICPFARRELERRSVRYVVDNGDDVEAHLERVVSECRILDEQPAVETTLLIIPGLSSFADFLDVITVAEQLMSMSGYDGVYQLAHFHPDYCFEGEQQDDPANYTNRAPYPTLHLLREASMEEVLKQTPDPEQIPLRNIEFARRKGADFFECILADIRNSEG